MNTKYKKVAAACFAGAAVCGALLAILSPAFTWLGFLAGACVGYVSYELREFLAAVPRAWRVATRGVSSFAGGAWEVFSWGIRTMATVFWQCIVGPHPVAKLVIFAHLASWLLFVWSTWGKFHDAAGAAIVPIMLLAVGGIPWWLLINAFASLGSFWRRECIVEWNDMIHFQLGLLKPEHRCSRWQEEVPEGTTYREFLLLKVGEKGWRVVEPTVWNVLRWLAFSPLVLVTGCFEVVSKFLKTLFLLIHKTERVTCAVDSVIGGALGWWLFRGSPAAPVWLLATCCGAIGAAVGIAHARLSEPLVSRFRGASA